MNSTFNRRPFRSLPYVVYLAAISCAPGLALAANGKAEIGAEPSPPAQARKEPSMTPNNPVVPNSAQPTVDLPSTLVVDTPISGYVTQTSASSIRTDTPLKEYPASIQVVPNELLKDRGVTRIDQVAETVSGVHAEANYGGNGGTFFNIRGFSESNGLRDGFRNYGYYAFRDVQNIDQVEIFKGPAGALYGGIGAIGGYINTVSKRPEWSDFGEVTGTAGSHDLARSTLDVNRVLNEDLSVRVNASAEHDSSFRDDTRDHSWSFAPAITWDNHDGTSLTLLSEYNHLNRDGFDFGVPAVANYRELSKTRYYGLSRSRYAGIDGDYGKNDTLSETLLFEHQLSDTWKLRLAGQYSYARQRSTQSFPNSTTATDNLLDYSVYSNANESSRQLGTRAELVGDIITGDIKHQLLIGTDYSLQKISSSGSQVSAMTLDLSNPDYFSGLTPAGSLNGHESQGKDYGAYVQDLIELTPTIKLQAALRADRFVNRARESGGDPAQGQQSTLSPRVGVVWQATDSTSYFADWSLSHSPNVGHSGSNVTYEAEVAEQFEVGLKHELIKDRLDANLAVFNLDRNHILTTDPDNPLLQVLTGKQRSQGVELDITGNITPRWKTAASYTYTVAKVRSDSNYPVGDVLSNAPRHSANLWTAYQLKSVEGLQVGGGIYYVGSREATLPNTFKLSSYVRTDVMASYKVGGWTTQMNVFNLFDRTYYTGGTAATFDYTLMPSPPRTVQLSETYRF
ncbi:TonB-dependent receptor [Pseudomonas sp. W5-36]|uniref:TonB-dependent receptor n=1 Tax=Pseudomonas sp. W5-36 TaxID=3097455 RepID=UPI00397C0C37